MSFPSIFMSASSEISSSASFLITNQLLQKPLAGVPLLQPSFLHAYMRGKEMVLTLPNSNPITVEARPSMLYVKSAHANKMVCRIAKSNVLKLDDAVEAPPRRLCLLQIISIFGTVMCKNPLLVDGPAKADEKTDLLLIGLGESSSNELVLSGSPYTTRLGRPRVSSLKFSNDEVEEIIAMKIKLLRGKASAFRVFINLPNADEQTSITCPEFAGFYFHEPRRVKSPDFEYQVTKYNIGIGEIIKDLGLMEQPSILVTFVPCGGDKGLPVVLESVQIELA